MRTIFVVIGPNKWRVSSWNVGFFEIMFFFFYLAELAFKLKMNRKRYVVPPQSPLPPHFLSKTVSIVVASSISIHGNQKAGKRRAHLPPTHVMSVMPVLSRVCSVTCLSCHVTHVICHVIYHNICLSVLSVMPVMQASLPLPFLFFRKKF
jgi:hypothetical protein